MYAVKKVADSASSEDRLARWLAGISHTWVMPIGVSLLFALSAWPTLLVALPPFQDLPNHLATAHIVAHPALYPEYAFNGLLKSNALLTLWFQLAGGHDLFAAARAFTVIVLGVTALALVLFVLHFRGPRHLPVALLFAWPLVHSFAVSMGFLNFAFAFALSLILLIVIDAQRTRPTFARGVAIAFVSGVVWYAHPFPFAIVAALVLLHVGTARTRQERLGAATALLLPLLPAIVVALASAGHHFIKPEHAGVSKTFTFSYLNPWELLVHLWTDVSGALTPWGSTTIVPALLLPWFAWKGRRAAPALFSTAALASLAAAYLALPVMLSNWWHFNCRLVPFLWAGVLLRLPSRLPRSCAIVLATSALAYSAATGIDYIRLDRDTAELTSGVDVVPEGATLLPLMFKRSRTSYFTASLAHAWGYYTVLKDTSAPLAFAVERSYPITYRAFPPPALRPPALDRFAELRGTPAQVCGVLGRLPVDAACTAAWKELWSGFWRDAEPRFSHLLTWAIPPEARPMIPQRYRRIFANGDLEIYERSTPASRRRDAGDRTMSSCWRMA